VFSVGILIPCKGAPNGLQKIAKCLAHMFFFGYMRSVRTIKSREREKNIDLFLMRFINITLCGL